MALSKSAPASVKHAERKAQALELRTSGATYEQIGQRIGVSKPQAWRLVNKALGELNEKASEQAERLRALENTRLDALQAAVWTDATAGKIGAVRACLLIAERRARLNGLDLGHHGISIGMQFDPENPPTVRVVPDTGPLLPRGMDGDDVDSQ